MKYPDPTLYAIPFFLVTLALEPLLLAQARRSGRSVAGYEWRDTLASIGMGLVSLVFVGIINFGVFALAEVLWAHRFCDLGRGLLGWTVAIVGWDLSYYGYHRVEHENRLLWACHVSHHSSRRYNLSTALRQPWTPVFGVVFYSVWSLAGVSPWMIMVSGGVNLVYQYWVHTEAVDRTPRWFEAVFNTPSHHRVHHGSNPQYLDRNYGGIFIVWDRLFGSFEPEGEPVVYGLTKNIESYSLFAIAFQEYLSIALDMWRAKDLRERLGIVAHGPAWRPPSLGGR
jgi:sterol desaturase/sphingolipid hydroxylase (fatty acid hydroxylase superfamily)